MRQPALVAAKEQNDESGGRSRSAAERVDSDVFVGLATTVRGRVEDYLQRQLASRMTRALSLDVNVEATLDAASVLTLRGGKRFRAALLAAAHWACGGNAESEAVTAMGAALELLQTYLLVHDDWMDESDVRRGGPSVHALLRERFASAKQGDVCAILAGDYFSAVAGTVLLEAKADPAVVLECARVFARMHEEVILGQLLDANSSVTPATDLKNDLKTASYTVRGPVLMGAVLARANSATLEALEEYATPLGIAFQLCDDLLGTFGDAAKTGKPVGDDIRQGKHTVLIEELLRDARHTSVLEGAFGIPDAPQDAVAAVVEAMVASGARQRAEAGLEGLLTSARKALGRASLEQSGAQALRGAISLLADREY